MAQPLAAIHLERWTGVAYDWPAFALAIGDELDHARDGGGIVAARYRRFSMDYEVGRFTRHCTTTGRELAPGEEFYSALIEEGTAVVRRDYAAEAWHGPPPKAVGWWKSRVPVGDEKPKPQWAPNDVMLELFEQWADQPEQAELRYVLALLLVRRRILRLEETRREGDEESLLMYCPRNGQEYLVRALLPGEERLAEIQAELGRLLFSGAS